MDNRDDYREIPEKPVRRDSVSRTRISEFEETPVNKKKKKSKGTKIFTGILIALIVILIVFIGGIFIYMNSLGIKFAKPNDIPEDNSSDIIVPDDLVEEDKKEYKEMIASLRDNSDMNTQLYNWYNNEGEHMSSRNILNILIVGTDTRGKDNTTGNSDVMMIASINREKKTITLCSLLRDSYTYYETSSGKGHYDKLNSAYSYGGISTLENAIENNYKIDIDYFVAVDFEGFKKVIDVIGGVTLDVEQFEAEGIEKYAKISNVPYGKNVTLTGEQALYFCRMRYIYNTGDVHRTENQRKVINAIIQKAQTLGISELNNVVQALGEYIYTDCSTTKIISLGTNALLGKWYNYQVYSMVAPPEDARKSNESKTWWLWLVNYPLSAQYVQTQLYGQSNIVLQ